MERSAGKAMFIVAIFLMGFLTTASEGAREGPMPMPMGMKMMTEKEAHEAVDRLYNPKAFGRLGSYGLRRPVFVFPAPVVTAPVLTYPYTTYPFTTYASPYPYPYPYPAYVQDKHESEAEVPKNGKVGHQVGKEATSP